jgi:EAL domain-containing protein (putative c-di-GMP-specific phosphodiesterase class I)
LFLRLQPEKPAARFWESRRMNSAASEERMAIVHQHLATATIAAGATTDDGDAMTLAHLQRIIEQRSLTARFQPIVEMQNGDILGYEGLIRGPSDSPLHSPINLFKAASAHNLTVVVEHLCRKIVLEEFFVQNLPGKLFLNVSPECLIQRDVRYGETLDYIHQLGVNPDRVIIELT